MTPSLLLAVLASGFIYGITPGPGVLAVFGIGAARGRRAGAGVYTFPGVNGAPGGLVPGPAP